MKAFNWTEFQAIQNEWQNKNFGEQPNGHRCLLGMIEEVGELGDAPSTEEELDAVGDIMVYMTGYCGDNNLNMSELWDDSKHIPIAISRLYKENILYRIFMNLGRVSHAHLKTEQKIRADRKHKEIIKNNLSYVMAWLSAYLRRYYGVEMSYCMNKVWKTVGERNWVENPVDGQAT